MRSFASDREECHLTERSRVLDVTPPVIDPGLTFLATSMFFRFIAKRTEPPVWLLKNCHNWSQSGP
jgi:hypothetical protein